MIIDLNYRKSNYYNFWANKEKIINNYVLIS